MLQCGDRLAVCKRPSRGLLAGLWQLPDVPGKLETAEALRQAEQWCVHPTGILKTAERTHIFTHVQWDLRGVWLTCAAEAPQFTWADENALQHRGSALPDGLSAIFGLACGIKSVYTEATNKTEVIDMEDKRAQYGEDEIITLEFDDGVTFDCGMMGTFELDGKEYIALEALDDSDDVYLYGYQRNDTDFDLLDIPEEEFDRVAAEFDRLMDEPI